MSPVPRRRRVEFPGLISAACQPVEEDEYGEETHHLAGLILAILHLRYNLVATGIQRSQMSGDILLADDERTPSRHDRVSARSALLVYVDMLRTLDLVGSVGGC